MMADFFLFLFSVEQQRFSPAATTPERGGVRGRHSSPIRGSSSNGVQEVVGSIPEFSRTVGESSDCSVTSAASQFVSIEHRHNKDLALFPPLLKVTVLLKLTPRDESADCHSYDSYCGSGRQGGTSKLLEAAERIKGPGECRQRALELV